MSAKKNSIVLLRINVVLVMVLIATLSSTSGSAQSTPVSVDNPLAIPESDIFNNSNPGGTLNGPGKPTVFTLDRDARITTLITYHWNHGRGAAPGTIGLRDKTGKLYGPFAATASSGQGSALNVNWTARPNITVPAGTYTVLDSDRETWSNNAESGFAGFTHVRGYFVDVGAAGDNPKTTQPYSQNLRAEVVVASRTSDRKDRDGNPIPPWKEVRIQFQLEENVAVGDKVTVLPLDISVAALSQEIVGSEESVSCVEGNPTPWSYELEPITDARLLRSSTLSSRNPGYPFEVLVIYPAVASALQIPKSRLTASMLPREVKTKDVQAAVDLTGDGVPDLVVTYYCCDGRSNSLESCDHTCGETYLKVGSRWKEIARGIPLLRRRRICISQEFPV